MPAKSQGRSVAAMRCPKEVTPLHNGGNGAWERDGTAAMTAIIMLELPSHNGANGVSGSGASPLQRVVTAEAAAMAGFVTSDEHGVFIFPARSFKLT
jgi:hypothetical protein